MCERGVRKGKHLPEGVKGFWFIVPSFVGVSIFSLIPFTDVLRRSFCNPFTGKWNGFQNYKIIFENFAFRLALKNMIIFLIICIPVLCILSLLLSSWVEQFKERRNWLKTIFLIPMILPVSAVVLFCNILFLENGFLELVILYIWKNVGYTILLWCAALEVVPEEMYDASALDGANKFQQFWYVTLPQVSTSGFIIVVISIINSFKVFRESYMLSGDYPQESIYMTQNIFNNWFRNLAIDKISAGAIVISVMIGILVIGLEKCWQRNGNVI